MLRRFAFCLSLLALLTVLMISNNALGEEPESYDEIVARLNRLEAELAATKTQLKEVQVVRLPGFAERQNAQAPALTPASTVAYAPAPGSVVSEGPMPPTAESYVTMTDLQEAMKKAAWSKGDYSIVPYGYICVSAVEETERSVPGDFALWILSPDVAGERAFYIDPKSTRLGADIGGPDVCLFGRRAKITGKVEVDFQGQYIDENKPGLLFRQGFATVDNGQTQFIVGQTWEIVSPLYPKMISYVPGSSVGNIGYRRAMVRLDHKFDISPSLQLLWQGSMNSDVVTNVPLNSTYVSGYAGSWPILEMRTALTIGDRCPGSQPMIFGVSGHFGDQEFDFRPYGGMPAEDDAMRRTWSFNADFRLPLSERWSLDGEFFTGENLADFLGGILQSVDLGTRRGIRSTGGWFALNYQWTKKTEFHFGYTIDDPFNQDITTASGRTYNHEIWGNIIYRPHKRWMLAFEASSWKTLYHDLRPGEAMRFEAQTRFFF